MSNYGKREVDHLSCYSFGKTQDKTCGSPRGWRRSSVLSLISKLSSSAGTAEDRALRKQSSWEFTQQGASRKGESKCGSLSSGHFALWYLILHLSSELRNPLVCHEGKNWQVVLWPRGPQARASIFCGSSNMCMVWLLKETEGAWSVVLTYLSLSIQTVPESSFSALKHFRI